MHTLTKKRLAKFSKEKGYTDLSEGEQFERYIACTYLHRHIGESPEAIDATITGGGNDEGIDIASIFINGKLVLEPKDITDTINEQRESSARVIFIQTKTSEKFNTQHIAKFLSGVKRVTELAIDDDQTAQINIESTNQLSSKLRDVADLIRCIMDNIDCFRDTAIPLELHYVTTAKSPSAEARHAYIVESSLTAIQSFNIYKFDSTDPLHLDGADEIARRTKERFGPQDVKFKFQHKLPIWLSDTRAHNLDSAYIGLLPISELHPLLCDELGRPRESIYMDNVRQFLGNNNPVNAKIFETLNSDDHELFPILNNGITIIASKLVEANQKMTISGYQIVNGAQTCSQIIRWLQAHDNDDKHLTTQAIEKILVPVKIIVSQDEALRSRVAVATNLQTAILKSDIQASSHKAKEVEEYFNNTGDAGLRYERQKGEQITRNVAQTRVFSTESLNRAVAAATFGDAHTATTNPKELTEEYSYIWKETNPLELYFYSAWILYLIDTYFRRPSDDSVLKVCKYYIATIVSAALIDDLRDAFLNIESIDRRVNTIKNMKRELFKIDDQRTERIRELIQKACDTTRIYFSEQLRKGTSLRKDDVRRGSTQKDLLNAFFSSH